MSESVAVKTELKFRAPDTRHVGMTNGTAHTEGDEGKGLCELVRASLCPCGGGGKTRLHVTLVGILPGLLLIFHYSSFLEDLAEHSP